LKQFRRALVLVILSMAALGPAANAELLVGYDDSSTGGITNAWSVDVGTGISTALWGDANPDVWGMAFDPATATVYANGGSSLYAGPVSPGTNPSLLGTITDVAGATKSFVGLTWANGSLYASCNVANEAIYRIDLSTLVASVVLDYEDAEYDFGGLGYNPADGLMYGTNDSVNPFGRGLFSIDVFGGGSINLVTPYPPDRTDIDGLTIGDNVAYMVEDESGDTIHRYDLVAGAYLTSLTSPMVSTEIFSGAAWVSGRAPSVPEPAGLGLAGVALLCLRRRR